MDLLFVVNFGILFSHIDINFLNLAKSQQQSAGAGNITHTTTTLSEARAYLAATSSGELVFFAGGNNSTGQASDRVDIYNVTSGSWTTATLSIPRRTLAATSSQNLVFFGGGWDGNITAFNRVDIYNTLNGSWSTATLSQPRWALAATSVGNLVLFGGGASSNGSFSLLFSTVDVYNLTNNTWTTATLSDFRFVLTATSVDNRYALFAGGQGATDPSNVVDIFDSLSGMWNTTTLSRPRSNLAATSLGNLAFFGGGFFSRLSQYFADVDIFNSTSQTWSTSLLSQPRGWLAASSLGEIVAFGGGWNGFSATSVVDMLNVTSNIWFTVTLSQPRAALESTSTTKQLLFGGGDNIDGRFNIVDVFQLSPLPNSNSVPTMPTVLITPITPISSLQNDTTPNGYLLIPIVGIVIGVVALLIGVGLLLVFLFIRRKKQKKMQQSNSSNVLRQEKNTTELSKVGSSDNLFEFSPKQIKQTEVLQSIQPSLLSSISPIKRSQISFNELTIEKEIAEGSYGKVYLGKWNGVSVALKFCKRKGNLDEFLNEVKLMLQLPPHPNVVQMFGVSLDGPQPVIIMEYCAGGSLDKLLFDLKVKLSEEHKLRLIRGIAAGMLHLHKHNIIHRDLAARNIALTATGEPKITDFGMSRVLEGVNQGKTNSDIGPIRWMAPESLLQQIYSKKTDVWMFGIVVWEIVAQREPHADVDPLEVGVLIRDQYLTPTIPKDCPPKLREVMEMCWQREPEQRPTFETICMILEPSQNIGFG